METTERLELAVDGHWYYCHYCDEVSEVPTMDIQHTPRGILWRCPCCGMYNDTEAVE